MLRGPSAVSRPDRQERRDRRRLRCGSRRVSPTTNARSSRPNRSIDRHRVTPYAGETLRGVVHATCLRGQRVAERGVAIATEHPGRLSWRSTQTLPPPIDLRDPATPVWLDLPDIASDTVVGAAIACNDEFFAEKENLLRVAPAVWTEGEYTDRGKWMDGWETRRRRFGGASDWCVIRLGLPGVIRRGSSSTPRGFSRQLPRRVRDRGVQNSTTRSTWQALDAATWVPLVPPLGAARRQQESVQQVGAAFAGARFTHVRADGSSPTAASRGCACTATSCRG